MKDSQNPRWFQKLIYPSFFLAVTYLNIPELFYKYRRRRWQKSHSWISKFLYFLIFISLSEIDLSFQMASSAMNQASTTENNSKNLASAAGKEEKARGRKRQTSKGKSATNLKEKKMKLSVAEGEIDALHLTKIGSDEQPPCRKLVDFIFHDSEGKPQPFEMSEINDIFITSTIMPMDDDMIEEKGRGVKCVGFGRIESWSISGYDEGTPIIWISTSSADYEVVKPAASYKKLYVRFWEKARVCVEVFKATSRPNGGNPDISVEELLGKVARSMSGTKTLPAGSSAIDFLLSLGDFIYNQLIGLDESDAIFASMPALISLRDRCQQSRVQINRGSVASSSGRSLKIEEGNTSEDGKLARLLQEEKNWKSLKQHNSRRNRSSRSKFYIKINEKELANDYPLPTYFKPAVQEMDEYIFYDNHNSDYYTDGLPKRVLNNWSLYNSDSRLISLELLPMKPCAETDVTIFGSGSMTEDDGSGFCFDLDQAQSSTSTSDEPVDTGIPIYLSSIKEWMIEFGCSIIFVSIRTDMAWYRLGKPSKQYSSWYEPILKTGKLAVDIISLLKEQTRVSRLSFWDVIKRVSEFDKNRPSYISSDVVSVEKYLMVHAQIILQLFAEFPDPLIKKSSFAALLSEKMEKRNHTKLEMKKKASPAKEINNMNPSASSSMIPTVQSNRKAMRATTTKFINNLWREYYSGELSIGDLKIDQVLDDVVEEDEEDEVDDDVEIQIQASDNIQIPHSPNKPGHSQSENKEINWEGASSGTMSSSGWALYRCAMVRGCKINVGGTVSVVATEAGGSVLILVEYMFETPNGGKMIHGRVLKKGSLTILGNTANKTEVFLTNECMEYELSQVKESVVVEIRKILWGHQFRKKNADADKIYKKKAEDREKKGFPTEYFCKSLYSPERGAFFALLPDTIGLGSGVCHSCTVRETDGDGDFTVNVSEAKFIYKKVQYKVDDFVYVNASHFGNIREDSGTHKAGRNKGLKAYVVCHLLDIVYENSKQPDLDNTKVRVRRFYRPEDISAERGYCSDIREVLYTDEMLNIPIQAIQGKCQVRKKIHLPMLDTPVNLEHIFFCDRFYDPQTGSMKQLPPTNSLLFSRPSKDDDLYNKTKGKKKWDEREEEDSHLKWKGVPKEDRLSTLDIFAGCGGLSEGLQKSGVSYTKWAIEYDQPAGMAFRHNNPHALVYIDNCNIILRAVMEKCGDADDSVSPSEAVELVAKLDKEKIDNLPLPGEVDFINGGPPCQGFSGMNRFSQSTWSKVQCEMILAFLSFADYFRPRFFLLENVRTFVSFNKGQTFHLTIASLLEMGYQVRFGILEAGTFGVSQSRKRAFIWAASPEEILPEWPEPMHVFAGLDLKVSLPGGLQYSAARSTAAGAPFRSITVRDTIGDLPPVGNGASNFEIEYGSEPVSSFQKKIRGNMTVLSDHISKEMNELNLIRCKHIPCKPGADWRDLPDKKVKLSTGLMVDLIPWCLPNTAKRHNQWKGLFGRLDWEGNFPTSITDPQPMGKVGMCFHPDQDRILTVREFARSQGFIDNFHFSGNIQNKYRQIGNAVPPPLAYALGTKLKEAVDAKK